MLFWLHLFQDVSNWIFKVTSHYSIFNQLLLFFLQRLIIYHSISRLSSGVWRFFEFLSASFSFSSRRNWTLLNISQNFLLSSDVLKILAIFYQLALLSVLTPESKASYNISQLSNFVKWRFENFMNFSYQPFCNTLIEQEAQNVV